MRIDAVAVCGTDLEVIAHGTPALVQGGLPFHRNFTPPGRRSEKETTVYKSMGHAMEDLVAANLVYQKAIIQKIGKEIEL